MKGRSIRVGVIAAAGKGTRAYPRTTFIPKPLFLVENRSILQRNIELQVHTFGVKKLYVIVGHLKERILEELDRLRPLFPGIEILSAEWTGKGLAADVASLEDRIQEDFSLILGDELYFDTDHKKLPGLWKKKKDAIALIGVLKGGLLSDIRKNYSVELDGEERVVDLIEKPQDPPNQLLGLGTYVFSPEYFRYFHSTPPSSRSGVVEITDVIDRMADVSEKVYAGVLSGRYFNINSLADYYTAQYYIRSQKFQKYEISLVLPACNNESTLFDVLQDFRPHVNEIIVADAGSSDRTLDIVKKEGVTLHQFSGSVYPAGLHQGRDIYDAIAKAKGDIVILASADGSYRARDLPKLLEYLKDGDMVVGTRTTRQMIEQGSNMLPLNRWMNVLFGKLVEILWWGQEPRFTDIGCLYRAFWKDSFDRIHPDLRAKDRTYSVEMMIEIVRYHMRCIEIPVSYYRHYGHVQEEGPGERRRYFFSVTGLILTRRFPFLRFLFPFAGDRH